MTLLSLALISMFLLLALLHIYWAFGGTFGGSVAMPEIDGRPVFSPSTAATIAVAVALASCAALIANLAGLFNIAVNPRITHFLGFALSAVFMLRAIGEFKYAGFFKRIRDTRFAKFDTYLFSPLCLFLSIGVFIVAFRHRA